MAYQAKRNKRFEEDFELVDENGVVQHTFQSADSDFKQPWKRVFQRVVWNVV